MNDFDKLMDDTITQQPIEGSPEESIPNEFVHGIFPTPFGQYKRIIPLQEEERKLFANEENFRGPGANNLRSKDGYILDRPEMQLLKEFIQICLNKFTYEVERVEDSKLRITQSWIMRSKPGMSHHFHCHSNSVLSGVFYPYGNKGTPLNLVNPNNHLMRYNYGQHSAHDQSRQAVIEAEPMTLCIFPSWLIHGVPPVPEDAKEDRLSLSFNTHFEPGAVLGDEIFSTELKF